MAAVWFDVRSYRIPNLLTIPGILAGVLYSCLTKGAEGLVKSLIGIGIPVGMLILLHILRMLGAGDIKLLAVVGGIIGYSVLNVMLFSFIAGGILSVIHMLHHHSLVNRLHVFWNYFLSCLRTGTIIPYKSGFDEGNTEHTIHFSIAILIGYSVWLVGKAVMK